VLSLPKAVRQGTHRSCTPAETLARLRPLMPALGITRLADVTGLDHVGLPVVQSIRPNSRSLSVSQGKGVDRDFAAASALMESIETWHAEHIVLPVQFCSWTELRHRVRVIDVGQMARVKRSRFRPELAMMWVEGRDLIDGDPTWLPLESVSLDMRRPQPPGSGCFPMSSNGLAGGNNLTEATIHGLCELIERDACTLWELSDDAHRNAARLDLATVDDPGCRAVIALYEAAGLVVGAWDVTSDVGVACFVVTIVEAADTGRNLGAFGGYGCHLDRAVALSRALTEAGQSRLTYIAASRDDHGYATWDPTRRAGNVARARAELAEPALRSFGDAPDLASDDLAVDLRRVLAILVDRGFREVVRVDLTRAELGIAVARVIVPGLETASKFPTFTPGRRARSVLAS
jgi:YcaO-like protein with predicted kinase domain